MKSLKFLSPAIFLMYVGSVSCSAFTGPDADPDVDAEMDREAWFEADQGDPHAVNEGELTFLPEPTGAAPVHHHQNWLSLLRDSLQSGWVAFRQCHQHLDQVAALQIVFRAGRSRALRVDQAQGVGSARVEGHSIQIRNIGPEARICLSGQLRMIEPQGDHYLLTSGPFMRRFLDGYYPMRVSLVLNLQDFAALSGPIEPAPTPGLRINIDAQQIRMDALFEGRLRFRIPLSAR